jgi:hypothetical protein
MVPVSNRKHEISPVDEIEFVRAKGPFILNIYRHCVISDDSSDGSDLCEE